MPDTARLTKLDGSIACSSWARALINYALKTDSDESERVDHAVIIVELRTRDKETCFIELRENRIPCSSDAKTCQTQTPTSQMVLIDPDLQIGPSDASYVKL